VVAVVVVLAVVEVVVAETVLVRLVVREEDGRRARRRRGDLSLLGEDQAATGVDEPVDDLFLVKTSLSHEDALVFRGGIRVVPVGGEPLFEDGDDLLGEVAARLLRVGIQDDGRMRTRGRLGLDKHGDERVLVTYTFTDIAIAIGTALPVLTVLLLLLLVLLVLLRVKGKTRDGLETGGGELGTMRVSAVTVLARTKDHVRLLLSPCRGLNTGLASTTWNDNCVIVLALSPLLRRRVGELSLLLLLLLRGSRGGRLRVLLFVLELLLLVLLGLLQFAGELVTKAMGRRGGVGEEATRGAKALTRSLFLLAKERRLLLGRLLLVEEEGRPM